MNANDIYDGITDIRDDLIDEANNSFQKRRRGHKTTSRQNLTGKAPGRSHFNGIPRHIDQDGISDKIKKKPRAGRSWQAVVAAVLVLAVLGGIFLRPGATLTAYAISQAQYPKMASYPSGLSQFSDRAYSAWRESVKAQRRDLGDTSALQSFFARSAQVFLTEAEGENRIYSPLNVYMALAMLAQLTGEESREQLLTLLGSESMEALRQQAGDVWNANYRDDGALTSILANSLWLSRDIRFDQDTMDLLARDFYASSYRGEMGSKRFDKALQSWLSKQTGGLLEKQAANIGLDRETVLAFASTVYFQAKWGHEFSKSKTSPETFHTPTGETETDFMHQRDDQTYYWGDAFAAVSQYFEQGGAMWFLLPDEGVTPEALLSDQEAISFLFAADKNQWEKQKFLYVNKSVPKFDVSSQFDLEEGLRTLGITDVFDPERSDFTPMTADTVMPVVLSQTSHAARVMIDEEGCTAAAFTVIAGAGSAAPPEDEVDFILDRPFLFCITGDSGLPLFVGVVNNP